MTREELELKPESELVEIAEQLGLSVNPDAATVASLVDAIEAELDAGAALPSAPKRAKKSTSVATPAAPKATRKRIIVHNQEGVDASPFVKVQVNGVMFTLPREIEVSVPIEVINVLNDAVVTRLEQQGNVLVERHARRFPFTVLGDA